MTRSSHDSALPLSEDPGRVRLATESNGAISAAHTAAAPVLSRAMDEGLSLASAALRSAELVTILTGAGISAESGLPTFRDPTAGWWSRFRPEELATPEAFAEHPDRVWTWYAMRRTTLREAQPNGAHAALAQLARRVPRCVTVTQNVDGLHEAVGHEDVLPLHGNLRHVRCSADCSPAFAAPASMDVPADTTELVTPPPCAACGAPLRPDVVWFGERLPEDALTSARSAAVACDVFVSVGTSNAVEPAASLPWIAASHGATVIVVNPQVSGQRRGPSIIHLPGAAGVLLPLLLSRAWPPRRPR